ncbi:MAG: hypothetical protein V4850_04690 [Myxococcota bacterium]
MQTILLWGSLLACVAPDGEGPDSPDGEGPGEPDTLVLTDEYPDYTPAGDAVYIRYDDVPNMVRATPAGVEALDLGARVPLWAEATPDGRFLLVLTSSATGVEHVLVEDGAIVMAFADQENNRVAASPDGRHLVLWFDGTLDPHTELLVDVGQVTLVDTELGVATRVATGLVPKSVSVAHERALVVGTRGALSLDLLTQSAGEAYDFDAEGVASGAWGYWGVISADEAYGFVSGAPDEMDATVVRLGLAARSVLPTKAPVSEEDERIGNEQTPWLFRVGDSLFAHIDNIGLTTFDPETLAFSLVNARVEFSMMEVQADRAVLYGGDGTHLLWTDPVALHTDGVDSGQNRIWFGDDHAVLQRYEGEAWHAKVLDLATGDTWLQPLQDVLDWAALMTVGGSPMALVAIDGVETYGLMTLVEGASLSSIGTERFLFGAMANSEAFYVTDRDEAGFIAFVDPVSFEQTEHRDFTALDLLREP